jgi:hypothetical protein
VVFFTNFSIFASANKIIMKHSTSFIGVLLVLILSACGGSHKSETELIINYEDENEELYSFEAFPLSDYELDFFIYLPDETADIGAATKPVVTHTTADYKWEISLGTRFIMEIVDMGEYNGVEMHREEIEDLGHVFQIEYLIDEPNLIYYKRIVNQGQTNGVGVDHVTYHCLANHVINGVNYLLRSHEDGLAKPIADYMVTSIKYVEEIKPGAIQ